jgi:hypothetical protein
MLSGLNETLFQERQERGNAVFDPSEGNGTSATPREAPQAASCADWMQEPLPELVSAAPESAFSLLEPFLLGYEFLSQESQNSAEASVRE